MKIRQALAEQDKSNSGWQQDLIVALYKVATTVSKIGGNNNITQGEELLRRALDVAAKYVGTDQRQLIDDLNRALLDLTRRQFSPENRVDAQEASNKNSDRQILLA